ncbi:MAG: hypothetical protein OEL76_12350 [Siculibacillus sp.]|nr:hypothetical protein [Siculibacillus sp.]
MATFNAGSNNRFTNVVVADHIDNRGWSRGADSAADVQRIAAMVAAIECAGVPAAELGEAAKRLGEAGGLGGTTETRTFYDALKKAISIGGETIRTLPGLQLLVGYLRSILP